MIECDVYYVCGKFEIKKMMTEEELCDLLISGKVETITSIYPFGLDGLDT